MSSNSGWICPKCGDVYAPYVQGCIKCNKNETNIMKDYSTNLQDYRCNKCNATISNLLTHICPNNLPNYNFSPYCL